MMPNTEDFDITGNIRTIEKLKVELLKALSLIYEDMLLGDTPNRANHLADILILTYTLSGRLGVSPKLLDARAAKKIKLELINDDNILNADFSSILKHLDKHQLI